MKSPSDHAAEDFVDALASQLYPTVAEEDWSALPLPERTVFALWCLKVEVCNGGFKQFLFNPVGALAAEVVAAANRVGCPSVAAQLEKAVLTLGPVDLGDDVARQSAADRLNQAELNALDDQFFAARPGLMSEVASYAKREGLVA